MADEPKEIHPTDEELELARRRLLHPGQSTKHLELRQPGRKFEDLEVPAEEPDQPV